VQVGQPFASVAMPFAQFESGQPSVGHATGGGVDDEGTGGGGQVFIGEPGGVAHAQMQ
jgi:hypothetical protein